MLTQIVNTVSRAVNGLIEALPDRSNSGRLLGTAYIWDEVRRQADMESKRAWAALDPLLELPGSEAGEYECLASRDYVCACKVSEPVKRFNPDKLAQLLHAKYKVPVHKTKELIEQSRLPTQGTQTYRIVKKD